MTSVGLAATPAERWAAEAELAAAVAGGDEAAFDRLVCAYQDRLYNFALRLLGSPEDAEEVVQDALVRAYRALRRDFTAARARTLALTPWLFQITLNVGRNRRRRRALALAPFDAALADALPAGPDGCPELQAVRSEWRRALDQALLQLPLAQRAAVVLRFVEGLDYGAIAAATGRPIGTVKSDVFRGARALRALLGEPGDDALAPDQTSGGPGGIPGADPQRGSDAR